MAEATTTKRAVINLGGKQHLVEVGQKINVNRLTDQEGAVLEVQDVLTQTPVKLKVLSHLLGVKIRGLKFKNKVRYTRHYGHRQHLSTVEVSSIGAVATTKVATSTKTAPKKATKKVSKKETNA